MPRSILAMRFLVAEDHGGDGDCASHEDRHDRDQQAA